MKPVFSGLTALQNSTLAVVFTAVVLMGSRIILGGGPQDPSTEFPKTSSYAPAKDLQSQIDYFLDRLNTSLDQEEDYSEADQARVQKDANLMILLFMAMAMHDANPPLKASAPDLIPLAEKLSKTATDARAAQTAYTELLQRLNDPVPAKQPAKWEKRANLGMLMKHVALINNRLRRSMRQSRFERDAKKISEYATLLALIAQATYLDTHDVKNPQDMPQWLALSSEWRDAAAELGAGVRQQDFQASIQAMRRMTKSCDDCHAKFRKEPNSVN